MSDYPQNWRISRSGFSIRTGWGDSKEMIAIYPYKAHPLDGDKFNEWLANAEQICKHHNQADLIESQAAKIERLAAENKQLRAVADAAARVRPTEHRGGWQDYVPGLMELKQALAALKETTK